ncbi:MAG: DUF1444 family protein [Caldilineaceae bacterium]|nr:DUF1444 family protein [Caldilineaceae bacterium]
MNTLLSLDAFVARVVNATKEAGFAVEHASDGYLLITLNDQPNQVNLTSAYQAYQDSPERLDDIIGAHVQGLHQLPALPLVEPAALASLLPVLRTNHWLVDQQIQSPIPLLARPFLTGLVVVYMLESADERLYVDEAMAQTAMAHGCDQASLHARALENLRQRSQAYKLQTRGSLRQLTFSCESQDGFAAMQVLLPELMERWARRIPGNMLIGIPNRDFITAFSENHPTGVATLVRQMRKAAVQRQHALYGRLLTWRNGEIREYEPLN